MSVKLAFFAAAYSTTFTPVSCQSILALTIDLLPPMGWQEESFDGLSPPTSILIAKTHASCWAKKRKKKNEQSALKKLNAYHCYKLLM